LDEKKGEKNSYLGVMGKKAAVELLARLKKSAHHALLSYPDAKELLAFCDILTEREK
jgi:hypothetical protein